MFGTFCYQMFAVTHMVGSNVHRQVLTLSQDYTLDSYGSKGSLSFGSILLTNSIMVTILILNLNSYKAGEIFFYRLQYAIIFCSPFQVRSHGVVPRACQLFSPSPCWSCLCQRIRLRLKQNSLPMEVNLLMTIFYY